MFITHKEVTDTERDLEKNVHSTNFITFDIFEIANTFQSLLY